MRGFIKFLFFVVIAGLLHVTFWPGSGGQFVEVEIKDGSTVSQIATDLQNKGILKYRKPLLFWTRVRQADKKVRVGRYRFSSGRSAFWIVDDLVHGRALKTKIVIPEGFASWQIAERLDAVGICKGDAFKKAVIDAELEGFLFPATYEINFGLNAMDVARIFKVRFDHAWTDAMAQRAQEIGWSQKEVITLASIIEREIRVRDELPMISAVYHNRLKKGMTMDADPTVQYALGFWKKRLTYDDYRNTKSPYNTYLVRGLPPGPICSPGIDAINAALWPAQSDALYILAQEDGYHTFSKNYKDHTNKVNHRNRSIRKRGSKQ
jgi:UPF0755 protein